MDSPCKPIPISSFAGFYLRLTFLIPQNAHRECISHQDDNMCSPVTSIRDSMVMTLYNADKELVSKTGLFIVGSLSLSSVYHLHTCQLTCVAIFCKPSEVKTKLIVELGTMDAVFTLDSGGTIILQLQFFLSDEDRKRIQEMVRCFFYGLCYFHESLKTIFFLE